MATTIEPATGQDVDDEALDRSTARARIASLMAALSDSAEAPTGYQETIPPFQEHDVDFATNAWLLRLLSVQGWLCLDEAIAPSAARSDPAEAAVRLCRLLGSAEPRSLVSTQDGRAVLVVEAEELLANRLERAVERRDAFLQALEAGVSPKSASQQWKERWEEDPDEDTVVEPIHAEVTTFTMLQVKDMAVTGKLNLSPTYQRGDVWTTPDAQSLIVSILSGIPLPSIIILKTDKGKVYEIVDGKQRLTSILRFMGQHPAAIQKVRDTDDQYNQNGELLQEFQNDYPAFRKRWRKVLGKPLGVAEEAEMYFPFPLPKQTTGRSGGVPRELRRVAGKYYTQIRDAEVEIASQNITVEDIFVGAAPPYKLSMIVYHNAKPRQIHHVFNLYNRQGKHLNAEEIRNALFHEVPLARLMLAAAGDSKKPEKLLDFFTAVRRAEAVERARDVGAALKEYRFGEARYKRTKVLSWLCALLLEPALTPEGALSVRSTAKHIDALFRSAQQGKPHTRLGDADVLMRLLDDLQAAVGAHSSVDVWSASFRRGSDGAWQELPLVASLVAAFLIHVATGDATTVFEQRAVAIREYTARRPPLSKAQNKTQWAFIGNTALQLLEIAGVDQTGLSTLLLERYRQDCMPTLVAAKGSSDE